MIKEVELKLHIDRTHAARLRRLPALLAVNVDKPVTRKLTSIYYDTPDLQLLDAGVSLRVRRMSGSWIQTVKAKGKVLAGLHQRMEWEHPIAAGHPDFRKITDPALRRIFDSDLLRAALIPIFVTEVRRTEWQLAMPDGSQIEMALDLGEIQVQGKTEPISEIELELVRGDACRLFELALELQAHLPLHIENTSKAQYGYAYYRPVSPPIIKATTVALKKNMWADEAFCYIGWECLTQLQGNQEMVLHGDDPEGVHQMRIALRRLRSAMGVFRAVIDPQQCASLAEEIRWIAGELGTARDLDVFLSETLPPIFEHHNHHPGLLALRDQAMAAKNAAYAAVRAAIQSQRYQRLLLTLGCWLEGIHPGQHRIPVKKIAAEMLRKRNRQLRRHGRLLREVNVEERHLARIAAKKLRYAAEFFSSLYPPNKTRPFLQGLTGLQDVLGTLNDITVTAGLVRQLLGHCPSKELDESQHILYGWNGCQAMHNLAKMDEVWQAFASQKPYWQ